MDIELDDDDLDIEIIEVRDNSSVNKPSGHESSAREPPPVAEQIPAKKNPVEEHLMKQLHLAQNQIDQAKSNIELIESVTQKIVQSLTTKAAYRDEDSSDSDSDLYTTSGEPLIRKKKSNRQEKQQVLNVLDRWQRIVDNKWIIGVVLENTTSCVLKEPTIYVIPSGELDTWHGTSVFWTFLNESYWYPIEEIDAHEEQVATAVLELPSFDGNSDVTMHVSLFCQFEDKVFQTSVPAFNLTVEQAVDGSYGIDFADRDSTLFSILALKTVSTDRVVLLPVQAEQGTGQRLLDFLEKYGFEEVCKICVVKEPGTLQYCLLEILPPLNDETDVRILISARSESQLSIVVQLLRENFSELLDVEKQQAVDEAAEALNQELRLYLESSDLAAIQRAKTRTDLLIS